MTKPHKRIAQMTTPAVLFEKYSAAISDNLAILNAARAGVDSRVFYEIADLVDITNDRLANEIFGISLKTVQRLVDEQKPLQPRQSEIALKLLALFQKGIEVFGGKPAFNRWLSKPAFGLGDRFPLALLGLGTGIELVADELSRIEFGATN